MCLHALHALHSFSIIYAHVRQTDTLPGTLPHKTFYTGKKEGTGRISQAISLPCTCISKHTSRHSGEEQRRELFSAYLPPQTWHEQASPPLCLCLWGGDGAARRRGAVTCVLCTLLLSEVRGLFSCFATRHLMQEKGRDIALLHTGGSQEGLPTPLPLIGMLTCREEDWPIKTCMHGNPKHGMAKKHERNMAQIPATFWACLIPSQPPLLLPSVLPYSLGTPACAGWAGGVSSSQVRGRLAVPSSSLPSHCVTSSPA